MYLCAHTHLHTFTHASAHTHAHVHRRGEEKASEVPASLCLCCWSVQLGVNSYHLCLQPLLSLFLPHLGDCTFKLWAARPPPHPWNPFSFILLPSGILSQPWEKQPGEGSRLMPGELNLITGEFYWHPTCLRLSHEEQWLMLRYVWSWVRKGSVLKGPERERES